jgi:hypothetical protein
MIRFLVCLVCALLPSVASAQLFPNAWWNQTKQVGSSCPGGVCPTSAAPVQAYTATANAPGHWSYPGNIDAHLEGTHGVSTAGLSWREKLNLHDALHEGKAMPINPSTKANYPARSSASFGSAGSAMKSFGSSGGGSFGVGSRDRYGDVITSIGPTYSVAPPVAKTSGCTCENCPCYKFKKAEAEINSQASFAAPPSEGIFQGNNFRKSLMAAAKEARDNGDISAAEYLKISIASRFPEVAQHLEAALQEAAAEQGLANATGAVDWSKLKDFFKTVLPIILELIKLFAGNTPMDSVNTEPYVSIDNLSGYFYDLAA